MIGASRFPVGAPRTAQRNASAAITSGPYCGGRGSRGRTIRGVSATRNALRAWSLCQPVVAHSSSSSTLFAALSARLYRVAFAFVTACRCAIVNPISRAYPDPTAATQGHAATRAFLHELSRAWGAPWSGKIWSPLPATAGSTTTATRLGCSILVVSSRLTPTLTWCCSSSPNVSLVLEGLPREPWNVAFEHERQTPDIALPSP